MIEIVGKRITLNNQFFTVVGVMPKEFQHQGPPAVWVLIEQNAKRGLVGRDIRLRGR